ncbi:unnamed protein product [Ectocarpus sp. 6 AP-2014]
MALTAAQQELYDTLSAADQAGLNSQTPAQKKQTLDRLLASKKRLAAKSAAAPDVTTTVLKQILSWDISGTADACILCAGPSSCFLDSQYSKMCPAPPLRPSDG